MNSFSLVLRQLGPVRIATMAIVAAGMIGFFMFMTSRLATPDLSLLYSDLTLEDSSAITNRLDSQGVTYEIRGGGTQVYVPESDVARVRLIMAGEGLPNGGSVGYELFDDSSTLGTTNFVQRINQARALEGELSRTISAIRQVKSARVHLVLPRREVFSRDKQEPSASVVLQLNGSILQPSQVVAIQHLVSTAVPGLQPSRISVIDNNGRLLARGGDGDEDAFSAANGEEARQRYESRLAGAIEKLLESSVGFGAVRAEVSADIDFDRVTTSDESYDPDGQVARSTQTVEQEDDSAEADPDNSVSVANNLPGADALDANSASTSNSSSRRIEETVNFEISRTVTTQVRETGNVKRLTVAVLVDGAVDAEGTYIARTPEELAQYDSLVKSAIGYDEARGDVVEIVNLQFAPIAVGEVDAIDPGFLGLSKSDLFRIAEIAVLGIVAILVLLLVVRPLMTRAFEITAAANPMATPGMLPAGTSTGPQGQLAPPDMAGTQALPEGTEIPEGAEAAAGVQPELDISQVDGRVQASSMNQVNTIISKHPDETVAILRQWMYQES
ncbi:MAG: flagellar M-ring protein FliF [Alphaproteobacteria bacterium]|nr:flagellar M-ring protein FliF [Alphaproteobacteria bacterium]